jgi:hypothetical protein
LDAKLFDFPVLFVVPMNHVWLSLGQPLGDVLYGISEGPESAWSSFRIRHGATWDKRQLLVNRKFQGLERILTLVIFTVN